jgi:hypothetical protein
VREHEAAGSKLCASAPSARHAHPPTGTRHAPIFSGSEAM